MPLTGSKTKMANLPLNSPKGFRIQLMAVQKPIIEASSLIISSIIDPPTLKKQGIRKHSSAERQRLGLNDRI